VGFVPLHLMLTSMLCLARQQPEVRTFLLKRGQVKSAGCSAVPVRVPLKYGDPSWCGSSGYTCLWDCAPPSGMQINILLSFPETSVL